MDMSAMIPVTVLLNDDLHNFVRRAVTDGMFDSMDDLVAHAIGLVRREAMLGRTPRFGSGELCVENVDPCSCSDGSRRRK